MSGRSRAPQRDRCARPARRFLAQIAICISQLAVCGLLRAQPPAPSVGMNRLPAVDSQSQPQPIQLAQLPGNPFMPAQTVPAPATTRPPLSSFRKIQVFPRSAGPARRLDSVTPPEGKKDPVSMCGVNVVVQGLSGDKLPATLGP